MSTGKKTPPPGKGKRAGTPAQDEVPAPPAPALPVRKASIRPPDLSETPSNFADFGDDAFVRLLIEEFKQGKIKGVRKGLADGLCVFETPHELRSTISVDLLLDFLRFCQARHFHSAQTSACFTMVVRALKTYATVPNVSARHIAEDFRKELVTLSQPHAVTAVDVETVSEEIEEEIPAWELHDGLQSPTGSAVGSKLNPAMARSPSTVGSKAGGKPGGKASRGKGAASPLPEESQIKRTRKRMVSRKVFRERKVECAAVFSFADCTALIDHLAITLLQHHALYRFVLSSLQPIHHVHLTPLVRTPFPPRPLATAQPLAGFEAWKQREELQLTETNGRNQIIAEWETGEVHSEWERLRTAQRNADTRNAELALPKDELSHTIECLGFQLTKAKKDIDLVIEEKFKLLESRISPTPPPPSSASPVKPVSTPNKPPTAKK